MIMIMAMIYKFAKSFFQLIVTVFKENLNL